ncbi:zinc finger CCCH domain-containing protein 13 [Prunus yedoensis var. nudiflora]|uniref:Zinc finger CCCH domain-containing protein 13 n=1 Tax=Prunus yedoensis var. nudiflora TaxID=2094558 RepID=A0A314UL20_PRUYE|nr:zinc finger CCCH domain-containing protein 13 [Prunus yedoensis var. nudiflora]
MSGAPKRPHEESGHSSSSKYPHDDSGAYPKLSSSVSNEYHPPYEMAQDSRLPKIPRTESRDPDRRSPIHSIYRMPSTSNDLHVDQPAASENRLESRDSKDTRDLRFENRDTKTETRELYSESRRDTQNAKGEKDVRYDSRGDDNKETKFERENFNDVKADLKWKVMVWPVVT